jgi:hypothetical protein
VKGNTGGLADNYRCESKLQIEWFMMPASELTREPKALLPEGRTLANCGYKLEVRREDKRE